MKNKDYKTIFFDWNKTLSHSLFWSQLANPKHERHEWYKNIGNFIFVKNTHIINDWMRGDIDEDHIADMIFDAFAYPKKQVIDDLAESCRQMQFVSEDVLPLIKKIRVKGVKCVIATDNMDSFSKYTVPALNLLHYFDDILVSFERKKLKFDCEEGFIPFFNAYIIREGLTYDDVVLVDDCIDKSGIYGHLGFNIAQVHDSDDFVEKLQKLSGKIPK